MRAVSPHSSPRVSIRTTGLQPATRHRLPLVSVWDGWVLHVDACSARPLFAPAPPVCTVARGTFFKLEPMRSYGGSPLGYLASFRAKTVLSHVLSGGPRYAAIVAAHSLTACPISGYLPIHAAVANGRSDVYDFLVAHGADPTATTVPTRLEQRPSAMMIFSDALDGFAPWTHQTVAHV